MSEIVRPYRFREIEAFKPYPELPKPLSAIAVPCNYQDNFGFKIAIGSAEKGNYDELRRKMDQGIFDTLYKFKDNTGVGTVYLSQSIMWMPHNRRHSDLSRILWFPSEVALWNEAPFTRAIVRKTFLRSNGFDADIEETRKSINMLSDPLSQFISDFDVSSNKAFEYYQSSISQIL